MAAVIALGIFAGCTNELPQSRGTISQAAQDAPYPELVPLDQLLARAEAGSSVEDDASQLERRLSALNARAAALRNRSVFDGATRFKLIEAGQRNAARL
ncbi:MAG: hypothetical protein AAF340_11170 [Pseudomonadota bacterium]